MASALVETYGDPLEADVAIGTMAPGELITRLRVLASDRGLKLDMSVGDILKLQRECRSAALPYIHARRTPVDDKGDPVTPVIVFGRADAVSASGGRSIEDVEENQPLIDVTPEKSDGEKSDGEPND